MECSSIASVIKYESNTLEKHLLFGGFSSCMLMWDCCDCCCCCCCWWWWWCNRPEWCWLLWDVNAVKPCDPTRPWWFMCCICSEDGCNSILIMTYKLSGDRKKQLLWMRIILFACCCCCFFLLIYTIKTLDYNKKKLTEGDLSPENSWTMIYSTNNGDGFYHLLAHMPALHLYTMSRIAIFVISIHHVNSWIDFSEHNLLAYF